MSLWKKEKIHDLQINTCRIFCFYLVHRYTLNKSRQMYHIKKAENFTVFTMKRKYAQNLNKYVRFLHFTFFQSLIYSKMGF